jgi:hypothetical protein
MQTPFIEQDCTIEHEGHKFTSGGAVVTDDYIIAYVGKHNADDYAPEHCGPHYLRDLTDWHGNRIGGCYLSSSWRVRSFMGDYMYQIYATVNGKRYTGRGMGAGMMCRLRPVK